MGSSIKRSAAGSFTSETPRWIETVQRHTGLSAGAVGMVDGVMIPPWLSEHHVSFRIDESLNVTTMRRERGRRRVWTAHQRRQPLCHFECKRDMYLFHLMNRADIISPAIVCRAVRGGRSRSQCPSSKDARFPRPPGEACKLNVPRPRQRTRPDPPTMRLIDAISSQNSRVSCTVQDRFQPWCSRMDPFRVIAGASNPWSRRHMLNPHLLFWSIGCCFCRRMAQTGERRLTIVPSSGATSCAGRV